MMSGPRELFLHELGDLLYAEKTLFKELPKLAQEATEEELSEAFTAHTGLITMAQAMGESEVVFLLQENLKQEKAALEKLEKAATRLSRAHVTV
ncbi:MAG: hypothetical protein QOH00_2074 [Gaiellales bacterium]|nr:hypothetical protein [Gaiellales bacterium]